MCWQDRQRLQRSNRRVWRQDDGRTQDSWPSRTARANILKLDEMTEQGRSDFKLREQLKAISRNKDILGHVFLFLSEEPPNASAAQEAFEEISPDDQIKLWSVSPTAGGIWESWERDALKYGRLDATPTYETWCRKNNRIYPAYLETAAERRGRNRRIRQKTE